MTTGKFFGDTNSIMQYDGITLTDTVYTHERVDWHYHENAYFTFILEGKVIEGNKKEVYTCTPGTLLFHHWQEAHYNIKPSGHTRGFHVEVGQDWFTRYRFESDTLNGHIKVTDPTVILAMYKLYGASKISDIHCDFTIHTILVELLSRMQNNQVRTHSRPPQWTKMIDEILHDGLCDSFDLTKLSHQLNLHPSYLCREFPRYFHCNISEYLAKLRISKALSLMSDRSQPLTSIAHDTGFFDQSHFNRTFKKITGRTPLKHRKMLFGDNT